MALTEDDLNQMLALYYAKAKHQAAMAAMRLDMERKKWMFEESLRWGSRKQSLPEPEFSLDEMEIAEKVIGSCNRY